MGAERRRSCAAQVCQVQRLWNTALRFSLKAAIASVRSSLDQATSSFKKPSSSISTARAIAARLSLRFAPCTAIPFQIPCCRRLRQNRRRF